MPVLRPEPCAFLSMKEALGGHIVWQEAESPSLRVLGPPSPTSLTVCNTQTRLWGADLVPVGRGDKAACVSRVAVPGPPEQVRDGVVPAIVGIPLIGQVLGHVVQHVDVICLQSTLSSRQGQQQYTA